MTRKGMDAHVLGLALGVIVLLVVLGVIVGLNTSGAFKDFLNKVPWLNKIIPDSSGSSGDGTTTPAQCGALCEATPTSSGRLCSTEETCKNNKCEPSDACKALLNYVGRPSGNVLHFIAPTSASGGNKIRLKISAGVPIGGSTQYLIKNGDVLEYDVYLPLKTPCTGGITIETTGGKMDDDDSWKDGVGLVGTLKNCDKDPTKAAKDSDMTPYAYRKWYHRVLPIPKGGKTLEKISLVMGGETYETKDTKGGVVYAALYDNIVIKSTNGDKHVFFEESSALLEKEGCGGTCRYDQDKTSAMVIPVVYVPPTQASPQSDIGAHSDEILKLAATGEGKLLYLKAYEIDSPYTIRPGDIIEYDVFLRTCEKEVGGIELRAKADPYNEWNNLPYWRWSYDWLNNEWVRAKPDVSDASGMDLTEFACGKWYHRILPAPPGVWGKAVDIVDVVIGYDAGNNQQVVSYYDNIRVTDGTGTVRWFYPNGKEFPPPAFDERADDKGRNGFKDISLTKVMPPNINNP
ncbi:MAG: hypothetical protein HYS53_02550 [Candidatus Aenigmarchaeota archaeon]|nr:hypothetical protein [Candidatus Aenigmarchaeota archaeon]